MGDGLLNLHLVLGSDLVDAGLPVESHSDGLVGFHEVIQLLCQILVLLGQDADVLVQSFQLRLEVCVVVKQGCVAVTSTFTLLSQLDNGVFSDSYLRLNILDSGGDLHILATFLLYSSLQLQVLSSVSLLQASQMVKLLAVRQLLVLQ